MTTVIFWVLAPLAAASGFMVFRFSSMARVTVALLVSFLASGSLLILLGLVYLGVVVILMMVMEMIIMAVFMIAYMMNPAGLMPMAMYHNKPWSLGISVAVFLLLGAGVFLVPWPRARSGMRPASPAFQLGTALMGPQMLTVSTAPWLAWLLPALPLAAGVILAAAGRRLNGPAPRAGIAAAAVTLGLACASAAVRPAASAPLLAGIPAAVRVDGLSAVMAVTVAVVTLAVLVFAAGELGRGENRGPVLRPDARLRRRHAAHGDRDGPGAAAHGLGGDGRGELRARRLRRPRGARSYDRRPCALTRQSFVPFQFRSGRSKAQARSSPPH
ncbi:MAG: hypothetical protein ACYCPF_02700 [Streptosporangiaceae bacterium]